MILQKQDLSDNWKIINPSKNIDITVDIPTTIFEALINNKVIKDPFYGIEEHNVSWVYNSEWDYLLEFSINNEIFKKHKIILCFDGLDCFADIYLNDKIILKTENMFKKHEINIKDLIDSPKNILKVHFYSPVQKANDYINQYNVKLRTFDGLVGVPYIRKAQYSFGWDWALSLPDIGIWKHVYLLGLDNLRIESVYPQSLLEYNMDPISILNSPRIDQLHVEETNLNINIEFDSNLLNNPISNELLKEYSVSVSLRDPSHEEIFKKILSINNSNGKLSSKISFSIKNPLLWWTHDLGVPNLYSLTTSLSYKDILIDEVYQNVGIREIRLVRSKDQWGESFFFLLNGIPIFSRGGNWIPIDQFIPRGKKIGLYELNLQCCKDANMNMIRVWGGGIYEDDSFYNICDELGLLVWQDFPFACSLYPTFPQFFDNVKDEAVQNIKRLRHHASLALWCGNNEIESLWFGYAFLLKIFWNPWKKKKFRDAYFKMFEKMLPNLIETYDPYRKNLYWPSSPSNGPGKSKLRLIDLARSQLKGEPTHGDSHFWKVWHMSAPFSAYRNHNSRFMSEFGFESFPSIKTLRSFSPEDQFDFYSPIMENHQKNRAGNKKIMDYMKRRFSIPDGFENQVILSQITQAEAMEYGVEHWRRNRNNQHCMGSLYWQINDCWPVASWASLDYYCRWKALHYYAKRFYEPVFGSIMESDEKIEFWITNDLPKVQKGKFSWKILNSMGETLLKNEIDYNTQPCSSEILQSINILENQAVIKDISDIIVFFSFTIENNGEKDKNSVHHGFRLLKAPKKFPLHPSNLSYEFNDANEDTLEIEITSENIALFVYLESETVDFVASDNYFSLEPQQKRKIVLKPLKTTQSEYYFTGEKFKKKLKKNIVIRSLYDLLH